MKDLTKKEIDIIMNTDLEWYPDDIFSDSSDITFLNHEDFQTVCKLLNRS